MELDANISVYYRIITTILAALSIIGYAIYGIAIWNRLELQKKTIWVMSLAISDVIISINLLFANLLFRNREWELDHVICQANAIVNLACGFASIASMTWIAKDLYYQHCKLEKYVINYGFFIGIIWALSLTGATLPAFGLGRYEEAGKSTVICLIDLNNDAANQLYILMVALLWFVYPLFKMASCYNKLIRKSEEYQMHGITVMAIFFLSYAPFAAYAGMKVTVGLGKIPGWMTAMIYGLPKLLTAANPYIYMKSDTELLQACKNVVSLKKHEKKH